MVLECVVVDDSSDDLENNRKVFIHRFAVFCKLLKAYHHLRNCWFQELGFWAGCDGVTFCLTGRFLSCLVIVGSTGGILRSACNQFLGSTVSSVFKVGVSGTSGPVGVASVRLTGSWLRDEWRVHTVLVDLISEVDACQILAGVLLS